MPLTAGWHECSHREAGSGKANCQVVPCTVVRKVENQVLASSSKGFSAPLTLSENFRPPGEGVTLTWRRVSPCRVLISRKPPGEMLSMAAVSLLNVISPSECRSTWQFWPDQLAVHRLCLPSLLISTLWA